MKRLLMGVIALLLCTGCASQGQEFVQGREGSPGPSALIEPESPAAPQATQRLKTPAPTQQPVRTPAAPPEPASAEGTNPPELLAVELEVIAGNVPIGVEEVITRFGYLWDNAVEPCITNMRDQEILTDINLEVEHRPAYDVHIVHVSFQDAPDLVIGLTITFEPYAKIGYGELTGDESPEIIILLQLELANRDAMEPLYYPFVLTKIDGRYTAMELPELDDTVELNWSPFYRGDKDSRFPDIPTDEPIYRIPDEWIRSHYADKAEMLSAVGQSPEERLETLYNTGFMRVWPEPVGHFAVAESCGKNYLLFRQYISGFGGDMDYVGSWISVLEFGRGSAAIVDKRLFLMPNV